MTEEEEFYYNSLSDYQKELLDTINQDLQKYAKGNYTLLANLNNDTVKEYLHDNNVFIYSAYQDKLNTPFAIMQYLSLYSDESNQLNKVSEFLNHMKSDAYEYYFLKNFTSEVIFTKKDTNDVLKVKFSYNSEDDMIKFYLIGHSKHFPVDFKVIHNLLTNKSITTINNSENCLPNVSKDKDTHITLTFNGMKITIEKQ